jgi:hypothetical protein
MVNYMYCYMLLYVILHCPLHVTTSDMTHWIANFSLEYGQSVQPSMGQCETSQGKPLAQTNTLFTFLMHSFPTFLLYLHVQLHYLGIYFHIPSQSQAGTTIAPST